MILIDTHVLVWMLAASERVGTHARSVIDAARAADALVVSATHQTTRARSAAPRERAR